MEKEQPILYEEKKQFRLIPEIVKNNCQLSALRAYKAVEFIKSNLNLDIKYFYIAGGALKSSIDNSKDRKIDIAISVHAAREEQ